MNTLAEGWLTSSSPAEMLCAVLGLAALLVTLGKLIATINQLCKEVASVGKGIQAVAQDLQKLGTDVAVVKTRVDKHDEELKEVRETVNSGTRMFEIIKQRGRHSG